MKVYAEMCQPTREDGNSPPVYSVEFMFLNGQKRSDKVVLQIGPYFNEIHLVYLLKQALISYLNATYAPETFNSSNVILV